MGKYSDQNGYDKCIMRVGINKSLLAFIKIYYMLESRISVIEGHNRDRRTDELYKPLRDTLLADTTAKKSYLDDVSRLSHISHSVLTHTYQENHRLGEQTLIPEEARLQPTHDLFRLPAHRKYNVINAQERKLEPISKEQLERRLKNADKQQVIVYVYGDQAKLPPVQIKDDFKIDTKVDNKVVIDPIPNIKPVSGRDRRKSLGLKVTQPKYNLFSIIDEAFNTKSCTCPANELIASKRTEANWEDIKKMQDEGIF